MQVVLLGLIKTYWDSQTSKELYEASWEASNPFFFKDRSRPGNNRFRIYKYGGNLWCVRFRIKSQFSFDDSPFIFQ